MRKILVLCMMIVGSLSVAAFADEQGAVPTVAPATDSAPTCMTVQYEGKSTLACFGMTQEQAQAVAPTANAGETFDNWGPGWGPGHHCEVRCVVWDHFGRCRHWRRVCW